MNNVHIVFSLWSYVLFYYIDFIIFKYVLPFSSIFFHFLPFSSIFIVFTIFTILQSDLQFKKNTNSLKIPPKYPQITKYKIKLNYSLILFMISLKFPEIPPKSEFLKMEKSQILVFQNHFLQNSILD